MTKTQAHLLKTTTRLLQTAYFTGNVVKAASFQRIVNQIRRNAGEQVDGWGLAHEVLVDSGKVDAKGRVIGFLVGYNTDGTEHAAWVQNTRNGEEFGVAQRSKTFTTAESAKSWGKRTAAERIAKLA